MVQRQSVSRVYVKGRKSVFRVGESDDTCSDYYDVRLSDTSRVFRKYCLGLLPVSPNRGTIVVLNGILEKLLFNFGMTPGSLSIW